MKSFIIFLLAGLTIAVSVDVARAQSSSPAEPRRLADEYYQWRNRQYPVTSSDAGLHTWDNYVLIRSLPLAVLTLVDTEDHSLAQGYFFSESYTFLKAN